MTRSFDSFNWYVLSKTGISSAAVEMCYHVDCKILLYLSML